MLLDDKASFRPHFEAALSAAMRRFRTILANVESQGLPLYLLNAEVVSKVWPALLYASPLFLFIPDVAGLLFSFEKSCVRQVFRVGAFDETEDGLFGELGWCLRLWSRVRQEAILLYSTLQLLPDTFIARRALAPSLDADSPPWVTRVRALLADLDIPDICTVYPNAASSDAATRRACCDLL